MGVNGKLKVMISSTIKDLNNERVIVDEAIKEFRFERFRSESMSSIAGSPAEVCDEMAKECDVYILIIGERYGHVIEKLGISVTEREYNIAKENNPNKVLVFIKSIESNKREGLLNKFIEKVTDYENGYFIAQRFSSCEQLKEQVKQALSTHVSKIVQKSNISLVEYLKLPTSTSLNNLVYIVLLFLLITLVSSIFKTYYLPDIKSVFKISNDNFITITQGLFSLFSNIFFTYIFSILLSVVTISLFSMKQLKLLLKRKNIIGLIFIVISTLLYFFGTTIFGLVGNSILTSVILFQYAFMLLNIDVSGIANIDNYKKKFSILFNNYIISSYLAELVFYSAIFIITNSMIFFSDKNSIGELFMRGIQLFNISYSYTVIFFTVIFIFLIYYLIRKTQAYYAENIINKIKTAYNTRYS